MSQAKRRGMELAEENAELREQRDKLLEALKVLEHALDDSRSGGWWRARAWLNARNVYNEGEVAVCFLLEIWG